MRIGIKKNRFHIDGIDNWDFNSDFFVYLSPNAELTINPHYLVEFRALETIGCWHIGYLNIDDAEYSNDFIIFNNTIFGKKLYNRFRNEGDITSILKDEHIIPILYPGYIKIHPDPNEQPEIRGMYKNEQS